MRITSKILAALRVEVERCGSQVEVSRTSGVHASLIGKYLNGQIESIDDENWRRLRPHLKTLKNEDDVDMVVELDGCALSDDEARVLRALPSREREKARAELGERFISFTLDSTNTG